MTAGLLRRRRWAYLPLLHCDPCGGPRPHTERGCLGCLAREGRQ